MQAGERRAKRQAGKWKLSYAHAHCLQANRDSARRSKQKKKQEIADLSSRKAQLSEHNKDLVEKVKAELARVRELQSENTKLRQQTRQSLVDKVQ